MSYPNFDKKKIKQDTAFKHNTTRDIFSSWQWSPHYTPGICFMSYGVIQLDCHEPWILASFMYRCVTAKHLAKTIAMKFPQLYQSHNDVANEWNWGWIYHCTTSYVYNLGWLPESSWEDCWNHSGDRSSCCSQPCHLVVHSRHCPSLGPLSVCHAEKMLCAGTPASSNLAESEQQRTIKRTRMSNCDELSYSRGGPGLPTDARWSQA